MNAVMIQALSEARTTAADKQKASVKEKSSNDSFKKYLSQLSGNKKSNNNSHKEVSGKSGAGKREEAQDITDNSRDEEENVEEINAEEVESMLAALVKEDGKLKQQLLQLLGNIGVSGEKAKILLEALQKFLVEHKGEEFSKAELKTLLRQQDVEVDLNSEKFDRFYQKLSDISKEFQEAVNSSKQARNENEQLIAAAKNSGNDKNAEFQEAKNRDTKRANAEGKTEVNTKDNQKKSEVDNLKQQKNSSSQQQNKGKSTANAGKEINITQSKSDGASETSRGSAEAVTFKSQVLSSSGSNGRGLISQLTSSIKEHMVQKSDLLVRDGKSELKLQLKPEYLGKLHVKLTLENGQINARLLVENQQVRQLLENNMTQLRQSLEDQGVNWQNTDIDVNDSGSQKFFGEKQGFEGQMSSSQSQEIDLEGLEEIESSGLDHGDVNDRGSISYLA